MFFFFPIKDISYLVVLHLFPKLCFYKHITMFFINMVYGSTSIFQTDIQESL